MQFALTPEQQLVADTARRALAGFAATRRETMAGPDGFDRAQWRTIVRDLGFGALAVEERLGGAGLGSVELALVMIELGRTLHASPFLPSIATALPLLRAAAGADELVGRVATGEAIAAPLILAEDAVAAGRPLRAEGLVPFGHVADLFVVVAGERIAIVPADAPGVSVARRVTMDLTRPLALVSLDLPAPVVAAGAAPRALDLARVALAAECVGGADAALDMTVDYAKQRIQFGRPIGSFQAIKHRLADMMIEVEAARTAVYYAAAAADEDDPAFAEAAAIAHATAIEAFQMCAGHAIQLHGGIGFTWEHDAHLYFKRARGAATLLGTPGESRERLAGLIGLDAVAA